MAQPVAESAGLHPLPISNCNPGYALLSKEKLLKKVLSSDRMPIPA
jgi:hypothetical protein